MRALADKRIDHFGQPGILGGEYKGHSVVHDDGTVDHFKAGEGVVDSLLPETYEGRSVIRPSKKASSTTESGGGGGGGGGIGEGLGEGLGLVWLVLLPVMLVFWLYFLIYMGAVYLLMKVFGLKPTAGKASTVTWGILGAGVIMRLLVPVVRLWIICLKQLFGVVGPHYGGAHADTVDQIVWPLLILLLLWGLKKCFSAIWRGIAWGDSRRAQDTSASSF